MNDPHPQNEPKTEAQREPEISPPRLRRPITPVIAIAIVVGLSIWLWEDVFKDRFIPKRWGVVEPGLLYRCGRLHPDLVEAMLTEHRIRLIIDLTGDQPDSPEQNAEKAAAAALDIEIKRFPLAGNGTGDVNRYAAAVVAVARAVEQKRTVLIHCAAGTQRTGGVLACYRLLVQGRDPDAVLAEMRRYDYDPDDNPALVAYLNENIGVIAAALVDAGVIAQVPDPLPQLPT